MIFYGVNSVFKEKFARENICFPARYDEERLIIYISKQSDIGKVEDYFSDRAIDYAFEYKNISDIYRLINTYYSIELADYSIFKKIRDFIQDEQFDLLFTYILSQAITLGTSDVHIFVEGKYLIVRFRINGVLKTFCVIDGRLSDVFSRIIKVRSNVDIAKTTKAIDARFSFCIEKDVDIRVSIISAISGDKISLRILDDEKTQKTIDELGLDEHIKQKILKAISKESGIILATGPTGSGKSTLIKCLLNEINDAKKHIVALEHPTEYTIDGITQIYIDEKFTTFGEGVKSILRQDPDVIFIGEIRDVLSAETAMRASITGHLVFTTLHTQTEKLAVERLEDLGVDKKLLFNSVIMILNQRLVAKQCECCKTEIAYNGDDIPELKLKRGDSIFYSMGCEKCSYSGIEKRILLLSLLDIDEERRKVFIRDGIVSDDNNIRALVVQKFSEGVISVDEVRKFL